MRAGSLAEQEDAARDRRAVHGWPEPARPERGDVSMDRPQGGDAWILGAARAAYRHGSSRTEWIQPSERGTFDGTPWNPSAHDAAAPVADRTASR